MKVFAGIFLGVVILVVIFGPPLSGHKPVRQRYYGSPEPILPMSFSHQDHATENCLLCHHNYVDGSGFDTCMHCHVTHQKTWPLFEKQFHDLCRGCRAQKAEEGIKGGPPRVCMACHHGDNLIQNP